MDSSNTVWILVFAVIGSSSAWLYSQIISYIEEKPPGKQSVFDVASRDVARVVRVFGSIYCGVAVVTRFESLTLGVLVFHFRTD